MSPSVSRKLKRCSRCLLPETHETLLLDEKGICNVCRAQEVKAKIDWNSKLIELDDLVNTYKGKYRYDCIIPFSGGKDSTWTLYYLMQRYPGLKPLVVRANHGFLRPKLRENCQKVFRKLGVDVHDFTPSWKVVQRLMLQSFIEKGDFCWHCHTGICSYPMQVAIKEKTPLIFWGEPSSEYTSYYSYDQSEEVNEERFNRTGANLGINAEDMLIRLDGLVDERDLEPFKYPPLKELRKLGFRSVCLGSYIPWDVKMQVEKIKTELSWEGDCVENVPSEYNYEKIECWMQGVRDYIKFIKRGYTRPSHLAAIDLRNKRISKEEALTMIKEFEGKRPPSLDIFLEYLGIDEQQFYTIAIGHQVSPWKFELNQVSPGEKLNDFDNWSKGDGLTPEEAKNQINKWSDDCNNCNSSGTCLPD